MKDFLQLKKNLKKDFSRLKEIKVAVLGDTSTQFLTQALKGMGYECGLNLDTWEADFDQMALQVFDAGSELYRFRPDIVVLFPAAHKLLDKYNKLPAAARSGLAGTEAGNIRSMVAAITSRAHAKVICYNYTEINDAVFGNYANKTEDSFLFQLRKLNYDLMLEAAGNNNLFICDLSVIQNQVGKAAFFQPSIYINSGMVLSLEVLPLIAAGTLDIIKALNGNIKKCLILDLDNTVWGGIIGDDGIEHIQVGDLGIGKAFSEFQYWVKKLKDRGIIIAVCSKNTEHIARQPFEEHPDMVLRPDDIAVFMANWETKVDNIRHIQQILNIGFDAMVFLDDNPFERNIVRENIPGICVPELPEDPASYLEYLYTLNLFETGSISREDSERTKLYQVEAKRGVLQKTFTNEADFLKNLEMVSAVEPFGAFNTPRVAQLSQRSNQFNLRTVRYTESDIAALAASGQHYTFTFTLEDKFGEYGLICVVILEKQNAQTLFIDTWLMSCRVLKRGMEHFVLNSIAAVALENGFTKLRGEYLPTPKNGMVKDFYKDLGFKENGHLWELDITTYEPRPNYINYKNHQVWTER